jgi:hypothetical protein
MQQRGQTSQSALQSQQAMQQQQQLEQARAYQLQDQQRQQQLLQQQQMQQQLQDAWQQLSGGPQSILGGGQRAQTVPMAPTAPGNFGAAPPLYTPPASGNNIPSASLTVPTDYGFEDLMAGYYAD